MILGGLRDGRPVGLCFWGRAILHNKVFPKLRIYEYSMTLTKIELNVNYVGNIDGIKEHYYFKQGTKIFSVTISKLQVGREPLKTVNYVLVNSKSLQEDDIAVQYFQNLINSGVRVIFYKEGIKQEDIAQLMSLGNYFPGGVSTATDIIPYAIEVKTLSDGRHYFHGYSWESSTFDISSLIESSIEFDGIDLTRH